MPRLISNYTVGSLDAHLLNRFLSQGRSDYRRRGSKALSFRRSRHAEGQKRDHGIRTYCIVEGTIRLGRAATSYRRAYKPPISMTGGHADGRKRGGE